MIALTSQFEQKENLRNFYAVTFDKVAALNDSSEKQSNKIKIEKRYELTFEKYMIFVVTRHWILTFKYLGLITKDKQLYNSVCGERVKITGSRVLK